MRFKSIIPLLTIFLLNCESKNIPLYVGTYTSGESNGIYQYLFNTETGEISNEILAVETENPSFITFSPTKKFLYAVNELDNGQISAFKIENDGKLKFMNKVSSHGSYPCHVSVNNNGSMAVVSNYGGGSVALYKLNSDGTINDAFQVFNHNSEDQISHAHSAQFIDNKIYVADLGRNSLYEYMEKNKGFKLKTSSMVEMKVNDGPRHFTSSKDGKFIYIINEYANTITVANKVDNKYKVIAVESTLSDEYKGDSFCADIHLSNDEKFLYGSNRGENSIVVFERDLKNGMLKKIQNISTEGNWPRNFTLDPTGQFLLVANQKSNNISVFRINKKTGTLSFLDDIKTPSPVCLLF